MAVASFNIRNGRAADGANRWELRRGRTTALLRSLAFDVAGLQEAYDFQLDDILAGMPELRAIGVGRDDGARAGEFVPIVYDVRRVAAIEAGHFWFSSTPEVPGSADWGNVNIRMCSWGRFQELASGAEFRLYNLHIDHESAVSREKSVELLLHQIHRRGGPTIVTGDFNAGEASSEIAAMRTGGFRDTYRVAYPDKAQVGTFHGFSDTYEPDKIDYIWVDDAWEVRDAEIVRAKIDGGWASDHAAVAATLSLGNGER